MSKSLRTLIVEDNADDAELLLRELRRGGYAPECATVETAEQLKAALEGDSWDIILSDWSLPTFTAPDALALLLQSGLDIPFVIVSGTVEDDTAAAAMRGGAHDFIPKDRLARLVPVVARELREAEMRKERRSMQEMLIVSDRMASVGLLAAGLVHEINNPLAAVLGNLDLVVRELAAWSTQEREEPRLRELLDEVLAAQEAGNRISSIVRDVKLFSRADSEKHTAVDVRRALESSLRMAQGELRHRARVVTDFSDAPLVQANESRLGQVFLNLIVNAAQAIPEGHVEANTVSLRTSTGPNGRVVVEVRDTGAGIAPHIAKRLFTPFLTTKPSGTGLGLSICHRLVTGFGGTLEVESAEGRGTLVRVSLLPADAAAVEIPSALPAAPKAKRRGRVLVIDDDSSITTLMSRMLGAEHDVSTSTDAPAALRRITSGERYDVVLCDLMMPLMTGMEFHAELTRRVPEQAQRLIFLTGGTSSPSERAFLDEVPALRLEKPFNMDALRALVGERVAAAGER